jgi:hypothetical protein
MRFMKKNILLLLALPIVGCGNDEENITEEMYSKAESLCLAMNKCVGNNEVTGEMCREEIKSHIEEAEVNGCENIN